MVYIQDTPSLDELPVLPFWDEDEAAMGLLPQLLKESQTEAGPVVLFPVAAVLSCLACSG